MSTLTEVIHVLDALRKAMVDPIPKSSSMLELVIVLKRIELKLTTMVSKLIELLSGRDGVGAKNNNLQRWTSTALTDAKTLVSKFEGRRLSKLESTIYGKVKNVEETTSNALAIVQHYAATRH